MFGSTHDMTILSYIPKNKQVIFLLTLHYVDSINPQSVEDTTLEIVTFHNSTKDEIVNL